jgi:post-segregation antitoxin (ccd killing protein)
MALRTSHKQGIFIKKPATQSLKIPSETIYVTASYRLNKSTEISIASSHSVRRSIHEYWQRENLSKTAERNIVRLSRIMISANI